MRYLLKLTRGITRLNNFLGRWFVCYLALLMFLLMLFEIIARYVFSSPTVWATELTQMLFGLYVILPGAYLLAQKGHVNVDIFYSKLPLRARSAADILTSVLFFAFTLVLLKEGWHMAYDAVERLETSHSAWNPPVWPLKLMVPVSIVLLILQGGVKLIEDITGFVSPGHGKDSREGGSL